MKVSRLSILIITALITSSCGSNPQLSKQVVKSPEKVINSGSFNLTKSDIVTLDKEYGFQTKVLSEAYFYRKLLKLIGSDNGVINGAQIVKNIEYARYKTNSVIPLKEIFKTYPEFYDVITGIIAVQLQMAKSPPFSMFLTDSYFLQAPVAKSATFISLDGFTANWDRVAKASSGYVLVVKKGTNTIFSQDIPDQAAVSYQVTGLTPSNDYSYSVQWKRGAIVSIYSNSISVTTNEFPAPVAQAATLVTGTGFTANWDAAENASSGYVLLVKSGTETILSQDIPDQTTVSFPVTGLDPSAAYTYTVKSKKGSSLSSESNSVSLNTEFVYPSGIVTTLAGDNSTTQGARDYIDETGTNARFNFSYGVALDSAGNLFVPEIAGNRIRKITPQGVVTTFAGNNINVSPPNVYADGLGTIARFIDPRNIAIDSAGNFYVSEFAGNRIRKITPAGLVSTLAGDNSSDRPAGGNVNATGTNARFNGPYGLTVDSTGNVYVTEYSNNDVRKITPDGVVSTFIAGNNQRLFHPVGVAIDSHGDIYISENDNNRISKATPEGVLSVYAGTSANPYAGNSDGPRSDARFYGPIGLAFDYTDTLYITENNGGRVRKITPDGIVSTLAGDTANISGSIGFTDGTGSAARFNQPEGIAVSRNGTKIYVAEFLGNRIRKIE